MKNCQAGKSEGNGMESYVVALNDPIVLVVYEASIRRRRKFNVLIIENSLPTKSK